jgi:hypothetical protein
MPRVILHFQRCFACSQYAPSPDDVDTTSLRQDLPRAADAVGFPSPSWEDLTTRSFGEDGDFARQKMRPGDLWEPPLKKGGVSSPPHTLEAAEAVEAVEAVEHYEQHEVRESPATRDPNRTKCRSVAVPRNRAKYSPSRCCSLVGAWAGASSTLCGGQGLIRLTTPGRMSRTSWIHGCLRTSGRGRKKQRQIEKMQLDP